MLTTTYACVSISLEQGKLRRMLSFVQEYLGRYLRRQQQPDPGSIDTVVHELTQFEQAWQRRRLERVVIPAVRGTTSELDRLLEELESLGRRLCEQLRRLRDGMLELPAQGFARLHELGTALEALRDSLQQRLLREEEELLPMLRRDLSAEAWFPIAAQILSEDAQRSARSGGGRRAK